MNRYRVRLLLAVVSLSVFMLSAPASAWEFNMTGSWTWEFNMRGQSGDNGFFGKYNQDAGATGVAQGTLAPLNGWFGLLPGDMVSGSDAAWNVQYMINNMELRINPAVRVRGAYWIGEWAPTGAATSLNTATDFGAGNLVASQYLNQRFPGIQRSLSPGYWNTLWLTAQLPWGELALGKRPSTFGTGLFFNGEENRTSESFSLTAFYGPLRIGLSFYPSRRGGTNYYNSDYDKNNGRLFELGVPSVTYRNGPVDIGFLVNYGQANHLGGESSLTAPATRNAARRNQDFIEWYSVLYTKYNNGRFFFNAEVDYYTATSRQRQGNAAGVPVIQPLAVLQASQGAAGTTPQTRDEYIEHWRWMVEAGVLCGPTKVSALYAWIPGGDRRNGIQIDRTGLSVTPGGSTNVSNAFRGASAVRSNTGLFRPYSYLMIYAYGLGTHINADTRNGYAEDASIYAARADYAVAANLNLYTSFLWADRVSQSGFGWGFMRPAVDSTSAVVVNLNGRSSAPSIPDTNLGYEIDAGFDWKLLEGLLLNVTFAYWQPGKWFNFACVDKGIPQWNTGTPGNQWGINPGRHIDPIWGMEMKIVGEF